MIAAPRSAFGRVEYKYLVGAAMVFGMFMEIMDTTIVNVALPRLAQTFQASTSTLEWVVTGYLSSLAVWIPASGWVGDRFGTKKTFLFAMAMFVFGSALCGAAWSIESLAVFRVVQGVGGGMMTPVGMAMLFRAFPPRERARASALLVIPTSIAPMSGPVLGGFLVDSVGWRWIFYVNVPIGIIGFLFCLFALREHKEPGAGRFDPWGFVLSGAGLASILFALSRGPQDGWTSPLVLSFGIGGLICFALLVYVELHVAAPMLDLRLFGDRMFRMANLVTFMAVCALLGLLFLLPLYLQELRGLSALESGLTTFPQAIGMVIMVQIASRIYPKLGPRRCMMLGAAGLSAVSCLFLLLDLNINVHWIDLFMFLRGLAMPLIFVSVQAAAFTTIPLEKTGRASSLFSTQRQMASAVGVALVATVLTAGSTSLTAGSVGTELARQASLTAFHFAFVVVILFALIALLFATRVKDEDAAASMRARAKGGATAAATLPRALPAEQPVAH